MSTTTQLVGYVRHDGAAAFGPDDRVRWDLTPQQQAICEAVARLTPADAAADSPAAFAHARPGLAAGDAADRLALLRAHAYTRRYALLGPASAAAGTRSPEYTAGQRAEMAAGGMVTGRPAPLYSDHGLTLHDYIDAVIAVTGAAEEEVWEAVGLRPFSQFGERHKMRTRAEAAAAWAEGSARRAKDYASVEEAKNDTDVL